ncbi:MAG: hypothetical protein DMG44_10905 [Acidobacteria bacterium]|jgi:hypothetical protein|nr:MAG: hypothetical protein DMG44_10905 [Acidobacteriota bacterium]
MAEEMHPGPEIIVAFQNYTPPFDAERAVRRMLRDVPPKFLRGLHTIVLTNVSALSRKERDRKTWGRRRVALGKALGYYSQEWRGEPAHITILVDNLERRWGRGWLRVGFIRDMELSEVLFHERGHHIHRVHRPEYEGRENVAEKWSERLGRKFMSGRYWYLFPIFVSIALLIGLGKDIAKLYRRIWRTR